MNEGRSMKPKFRRRSLLYVLGASRKTLEKSITLTEADALIFDLEDSVAPESKDMARSLVEETIRGLGAEGSGREIVVRVNPLASVFGLDDLLAMVPLGPDSVLLPKASARDVVSVDGILSSLELKHGLPPGRMELIPLIETAGGLMEVGEIIRSSRRISCVFLGGEDLTRDMAIKRTDSGAELQWSRNRLAMASKAAAVACIDTPYANYKDEAGFAADTLYAKSVGLTGRSLIHPSQIQEANRLFSPSEEDMAYASRVVAAYEEALTSGRGVASLEGRMIDVPVYERAKDLLACRF